MSMSSHVVGIVPPDGDWQKMRAIWNACKMAGVDPPKSVCDFFNGEEPDPAGVIVEIRCRAYDDKVSKAGFEVDLASLPKHVKTIRFFNCW